MTETKKTAAPRGTKNVVGAFMAALNELSTDSHQAAGKAAVADIRAKLAALRDKEKAAKAKARGKKASAGRPRAAASSARRPTRTTRTTRNVVLNDHAGQSAV